MYVIHSFCHCQMYNLTILYSIHRSTDHHALLSQGVCYLASHLTSMVRLDLSGCMNITTKSLEALQESLLHGRENNTHFNLLIGGMCCNTYQFMPTLYTLHTLHTHSSTYIHIRTTHTHTHTHTHTNSVRARTHAHARMHTHAHTQQHAACILML